jgi:hypothetical protein
VTCGVKQIVFDDTKKRIRPSAINQRTTLILRNIPSDAEPSSVEALLATVKIPKILNLRSDVGNNWFATFETEEATKSALVRLFRLPFAVHLPPTNAQFSFVFQEVVKTLKWGDKSIGVGIKCEKGLGLIASSSAGSSPLPYYMPMNAASSAGYSAQNGVFGGYANSSESGHGHYRHSGKGGPGGRRGPGSGPAGVPAPAEGVEVAKRQSGGKKNKLKGPRDAGVRDGEAGRAAGSSLPAAKEAQASLDLADFPVLEANPLKKTDSSSALDEVSAGGSESQAKTDESDAKRDTPVGSVSPGGNTENGPSEAQPSSASSIFPGKKLSYAQMAQATPTPAAPSTPAVAGTGQAGAQAVSPSVVKAD